MSKPIFKKADLKGMKCWYACGSFAVGTFNFSNGDDIPVCFKCAERRGKNKGQRRGMKDNSVQAILGIIPIEKLTENSILEGNNAS